MNCGSPTTIDAGERHKLLKLGITGQQEFQRRTDSIADANPAGGPFSGAWPIQPGAAQRGCSQPHRQPLSRQRFSGRENHAQGGRQLSEASRTTSASRCRSMKVHRPWWEPCRLVGNETALTSPFPDLNISPGQAFGYSKINEDREIVLNYYFNNGFPNATFEASAKPSPGRSQCSWT